MATVFLALNGDGLGHLVRASIACRVLHAAGEHPIIFSQGRFPRDDGFRFPGKQVPSLWKANRAVRRRVASELTSMAEISVPSIVVEDTHPNPISLNRRIRRVLLVRPTSFPYLLRLKARYGSIYSVFLLCDSPDSPTWPYSRPETDAILTWDRWHVIGPIYRSATDADILEVRRRYNAADDQALFVFTMGGGGGHISHPDGRDAERFIARASEIAAELQRFSPGIRLVFVKGPYFPTAVKIAEQFEIVSEEPLMPALLAAADGAFIRAGFNTTWECIAGATPFQAFVGTTFGEPISERLRGMEAHGLVSHSIARQLHDETWREKFQLSCQSIVKEFPGAPEPSRFQQLVTCGSVPAGTQIFQDRNRLMPTRSRRRSLPSRLSHQLPLTIRIDDVVAPEPALTWLLRLLASRQLRASIEVVPYLLEFDHTYIDNFDPGGALFEISQHGYAHVPHSFDGRTRFEFSPASARPSDEEIAGISWGRAHLEHVFGKRFTGGFSPPFNALPAWLPALWREQGGAFISYCNADMFIGSPIPLTRAGIDIWNWSRSRGLQSSRLSRELVRDAALYGHIGIVLHTRCLRRSREQVRLIKLLDLLHFCSIAPLSLRELALSENGLPTRHTVVRNCLWALTAWWSGGR